MSSKTIWTIGSILAIVVLVAGAWMLGISPRLAEARAATTQLTEVEAQNAALEATLADLEQLAAGMDDLNQELDALQVAIPDSAALDELVGQLNARAAEHAVLVTSIAVASPEAYVATPEVEADAELSQAASSVSSENFLAITIDLGLSGTYANVMDFIAAVQSGDRLFLVHDLSMGEGDIAADTPITLTATGQVFVLLDGVSATPVEGEEPPAGGAEVSQ